MPNRRSRRAQARGGRSDGSAGARAQAPPADVGELLAAARDHYAAGRSADAADRFGQILALDPLHAESLNHMGVLAYRAGQNDLAQSFFFRATAAAPNSAESHFNLGLVLLSLGRPKDASGSLQQALTLTPMSADAHLALANAYHLQGRLEDAASTLSRAIALQPSYAEAHMNLGNVRREQNRLAEAIQSGLTAATLTPQSPLAWRNLALSHQDEGSADAALTCFERALAVAPDFPEAQSGRLFCLNYKPGLSAAAVFEEHRRWGSRWDDRAPAVAEAHINRPDPNRRLRIGFVSGDFHVHPTGFFLRSFLDHRTRADIEIFAYANGARADAMTAALRRSSDHWRAIGDLTDNDAYRLIQVDAIDILIDLSGHTAANRLPLFHRRPAPVQASWLGYVSTTGLTAIDYVISDADTAPSGADALFTEKLVRLPFNRFCYAAPEYAPAPQSRLEGRPTFGSFNHVLKLNQEVIALWSRVLKAVPESTLRLKWMTFANVEVRERISADFRYQGIGPERIEFSGHAPHAAMLEEYNEIAVALDPFPFCGGLTTCEALWMGTPVVTLPGQPTASRQSLAFLRALGLGDFAATSKDDYVEIAAALVRDRPRLQQLRQSLRPKMSASPLTRGDRFAPGLEAALRTMWRRWCAGERPRAFDLA